MLISIIQNPYEKCKGLMYKKSTSGKVVVPETGLEPARRKAYAPKAYVYTNFTTRAWFYYITKLACGRPFYFLRFFNPISRYVRAPAAMKT